MDKYQFDHRPGKHRPRHIAIVLSITLLILATIGAIVGRDVTKSSDNNGAVEGSANTVLQASQDQVNRLFIDEPFFTMELPSDWKELSRENETVEHSITWQSTAPSQAGRSLKAYIDTIPATYAVNRLLPVAAQDNTLNVGDISDNCATFTQGGTLNVYDAEKLQNAPAKWDKVDFMCDLQRVSDNEVGTGSTDGINTVTVTGPSKQTHKYFFVYTEHNSQPNYEIFYNAMRSFKAK